MEDIMQTVEALNEVSCMPGEHMIVFDNDVLIRRTAGMAINVIREQQAEIERLKADQPVRCKNCKHRWERVAKHGVRFMRSDGKCPFEAIKRDDYYCADAEPKDGEQK